MHNLHRAILIATLFCLYASTGVAYERDSHYYLRFAAALCTCFDWGEAHLLASGDWMQDENQTTAAEMNPIETRNKIEWHAFGRSTERFNELWHRALGEDDPELQLIYLGQFMHFLEDWEAHAGFGVRVGHAVATLVGQCPDSLGSSPARNQRALQAGLDHLLKVCQQLDRPVEGGRDLDRSLVDLVLEIRSAGLLEDLKRQSNPKWRQGSKLFGKSALKVIDKNRDRIERFLAARFDDQRGTKIPADFLPGDPLRGLPSPIPIEYDDDGEVVAFGEGAIPRGVTAEDVSLTVDAAKRTEDGWRVRYELFNSGGRASAPGTIDAFAVHPSTEQIVAQASAPVDSLEPGERLRQTLLIPSEQQLQNVMIGVIAQVEDNTATNNEVWLATSRGNLPPVDPSGGGARSRGAPTPMKPQFLGDPKIVLAENRSLCLMTTAQALSLPEGEPASDPAPHLGRLTVSVIGRAGEPERSVTGEHPVWSASEAARGGVVAKTFQCLSPQDLPCARVCEGDLDSFEVQLESLDGTQATTCRVSVSPTELEALRSQCGC